MEELRVILHWKVVPASFVKFIAYQVGAHDHAVLLMKKEGAILFDQNEGGYTLTPEGRKVLRAGFFRGVDGIELPENAMSNLARWITEKPREVQCPSRAHLEAPPKKETKEGKKAREEKERATATAAKTPETSPDPAADTQTVRSNQSFRSLTGAASSEPSKPTGMSESKRAARRHEFQSLSATALANKVKYAPPSSRLKSEKT